MKGIVPFFGSLAELRFAYLSNDKHSNVYEMINTNEPRHGKTNKMSLVRVFAVRSMGS